MTIKSLLLGLAAALPLAVTAQPSTMAGNAPAFVERADLMLDTRNPVGAIDQLNHAVFLADPTEQAEFTMAMSRFERGEDECVDLLGEFIDNHPSSPLATLAQMRMADWYFYRGDYDNAWACYEFVPAGALDADTDEDLTYRRAYCLLRLARYDEAQALYSKLTTSKRYGAATWFYKAYIDYAEQRYAEATEKFRAVGTNGELGYQAQYYLTQIAYLKANYPATIADGTRLLKEGENDYFDAELNRMVGESYYHTGDNRLARQFLQRYFDTTDDEPTPSAQYTMGVLDFQAGDYASAVTHLKEATAGDDAIAQSALLHLGLAHLKTGDNRAAMLELEQAATMRHDDKAREAALYNYAVGLSRGERTTFDRSIDMFETFLNDYPASKHYSDVEGYLVDTYASSSDYPRALESINRIRKPGHRVLAVKQRTLYNLGMQEIAAGDNAGAITHLKEAATMGTYDKAAAAESRLWLAEAQYRAGDFAAAAASQQEYVNKGATQQNYALAQYNLGYSLFQQRKYGDARRAFEKAINAGTLPADLNADAYNRIGDTHYYQKQFDAARDSYALAVKADSNAAGDYALYQQATMSGLNRNLETQVQQIDLLMATYPKTQYGAAALADKAAALATLGRAEDALKAYDDLIAAYPKSEQARKGLLQKAIVLDNMGRAADALQTNKQVIATYPTSDEALTAAETLKLAYAEQGRLAELDAFLAEVPGAPRLDVNEVERLTFDAAEKAAIATKPSTARMTEYLNKYPDGAFAAKAHYYIGRQLFIDGGNSTRALDELNTALDGNTAAPWAEDAMTMQAALLSRIGDHSAALKAYRDLADIASTDDNRVAARLGLMRAADAAGDNATVASTAAELLAAGSLTPGEELDTRLMQALANKKTGHATLAIEQLTALAADPQTEQGAQAAYELAQLHYDNGNYSRAEDAATALIDAGTPHAYWLARTFIVLADVYSATARNADAKAYLQSLKTNYPGKEQDIKQAIDSRLASLNKAPAKKSNAKKKK